MTMRIVTWIRKSHRSILGVATLGSLLATGPLNPARLSAMGRSEQAHAGHLAASPAKLVEIVRNATRQYIDVNAATSAKYQPFLGCVSGPDHGAMGVHYVNGSLVGDGEIDGTRPEALIYEPQSDGGMQLVGTPNRYGLPAFFELHVWAWRDNPNGAFVDWNNRVSCEGR